MLRNVSERTPRVVLITRRRAGELAVIARAPLDGSVLLDVAALTQDCDIRPGDAVSLVVDPPFHAVTEVPPRKVGVPEFPPAAVKPSAWPVEGWVREGQLG